MTNYRHKKVVLRDLGQMDYQKAWDYQHARLDELVDRKRHNRNCRREEEEIAQQHFLLFCEHPPVYTLGKSGSMEHLLLNEQELAEKNISFYKINRGGDITFHGPGQVVGYPIFDLDCFFTDVHKYVHFIEEIIIRTLKDFEIEAGREEGYTGVWLAEKGMLPKRKICAIGVHLRRWVTMHGFALNVNTDLKYFQHIVPCGINDEDKAVTSMELELGKKIDENQVKERLKFHFADLFDFKWLEA